MSELDFKGLAAELKARAWELLFEWLPGGKIKGREYETSDLNGGPGDSLKVNLDTGLWADFATDEKGGDLISLYAAVKKLSQIEAARELSRDFGIESNGEIPKELSPVPEPAPPLPDPSEKPPDMIHPLHGKPVSSWTYRTETGDALWYMARYETLDGKVFSPWTWDGEKWVMKALPPPRSLYGIEFLNQLPNHPVLLVEGEKACDAARKLLGDFYAVVTWPGGANAVKKADFKPLYGKNILLWPDRDKAGKNAMKAVAALLKPHAETIKTIDPGVEDDGWDAADAFDTGWTDTETIRWAKSRVIESGAVEIRAGIESGKQKALIEARFPMPEPDADRVEASFIEISQRFGLQTTSKGQPVINLQNMVRVLERIPGFAKLVWFDEFHNKVFTNWRSKDPREWSDIDDLILTNEVQKRLGIQRVGDDTISKAVQVYAHGEIRNEPRDWMGTLKWDEKARIDTFFADSYGALLTEYARAASKNWWLSMVARIFSPGCKVDNMLVLEGPQGTLKSTSLGVIGGKWYTDISESPLSKDFFLVLQGKMLVEVGDLDSFRRVEETLIKRLLTCRVDRFRVPYGRLAQDYPRRCVFVGTTNEDAYLKDQTGGRRFWPIRTGKINLVYIKDAREQLFAEAVSRYRAGELWYQMPYEETINEQEARRQTDEWESVIGQYLAIKQEVTVSDIALEAIGIDKSKMDMAVQRRINTVLRFLGWTRHNLRDSAVQKKVWRSPNYYYEPPPY